jgi:5-methylcytosine-specific restriction endonuclease McrA
MENEESLVEKVIATKKWSPETARLAVRAAFQCEYCGLDFLENPQNYKLMEVDHIIPPAHGGSFTDFNNLALACKPCNCQFKRRHDPRLTAGSVASRKDLIEAARKYILEKKAVTEKELVVLRSIAGR